MAYVIKTATIHIADGAVWLYIYVQLNRKLENLVRARYRQKISTHTIRPNSTESANPHAKKESKHQSPLPTQNTQVSTRSSYSFDGGGTQLSPVLRRFFFPLRFRFRTATWRNAS